MGELGQSETGDREEARIRVSKTETPWGELEVGRAEVRIAPSTQLRGWGRPMGSLGGLEYNLRQG